MVAWTSPTVHSEVVNLVQEAPNAVSFHYFLSRQTNFIYPKDEGVRWATVKAHHTSFNIERDLREHELRACHERALNSNQDHERPARTPRAEENQENKRPPDKYLDERQAEFLRRMETAIEKRRSEEKAQNSLREQRLAKLKHEELWRQAQRVEDQNHIEFLQRMAKVMDRRGTQEDRLQKEQDGRQFEIMKLASMVKEMKVTEEKEKYQTQQHSDI